MKKHGEAPTSEEGLVSRAYERCRELQFRPSMSVMFSEMNIRVSV